jgi:uncharacterized protein YdeI (YjbR/CyaY-like superfamily)
MKPKFFKTPSELRRWFAANHATRDEQWIGFYKKGSGRRGVTYAEAVDEALCVGWIDGVLNRVDEDSYMHRFSPRRARSTWSAINIARAKALIADGRMQPAGLAAFERRTEERSRVYNYEQRRAATLTAVELRAIKANPAAWAFFSSQPPSYQRLAAGWVQSAKQEATRQRRLSVLIDVSSREAYPSPFIQRSKK